MDHDKLIDSYEIEDLCLLFRSNENLTKSIDSCDYYMRRNSEIETDNAQ